MGSDLLSAQAAVRDVDCVNLALMRWQAHSEQQIRHLRMLLCRQGGPIASRSDGSPSHALQLVQAAFDVAVGVQLLQVWPHASKCAGIDDDLAAVWCC